MNGALAVAPGGTVVCDSVAASANVPPSAARATTVSNGAPRGIVARRVAGDSAHGSASVRSSSTRSANGAPGVVVQAQQAERIHAREQAVRERLQLVAVQAQGAQAGNWGEGV